MFNDAYKMYYILFKYLQKHGRLRRSSDCDVGEVTNVREVTEGFANEQSHFMYGVLLVHRISYPLLLVKRLAVSLIMSH